MSYMVKEIFYTLQGEGANAGRPAVFCRFSGCNLWSGREQDRAQAVCNFCDTDFVGTDGPGGGRFCGRRVARPRAWIHGKPPPFSPPGRAIFTGLPSPFPATRYHSLIVLEPLPSALEVMAFTAEGEVMGLRHRQYPHVVGVQFHPESCLLYTSDAADERSSVDLGGRRIIKKKNSQYQVTVCSNYTTNH